MIIIWGTRMAGTCDRVGKMFYVRSRFFHVWYIPLIPVATYVVIHGSEGGSGFQGKQIPMSGKSILFGWLRTGAILGGVAGLVGLFFSALGWSERGPVMLGPLLTSVVVVAASVLVYWACEYFSHASRDRARELGEYLGIDADRLDQILDGEPPSGDARSEEPPQYGMPSGGSR